MVKQYVTNYKVHVVFMEPLLGAVPLDKELYDRYIRSKQPDDLPDDEGKIELVEDISTRGATGFRRVDGEPVLMDYTIKGFFKDACGVLNKVSGTHSSKIKAYKKIIDGLVFVAPRFIRINLNGGTISYLERPLRAQTMQGERVALMKSEQISAGASIEFEIQTIGEVVSEALLREWLDYGQFRGLGQWRNASFGRFSYTMKRLDS